MRNIELSLSFCSFIQLIVLVSENAEWFLPHNWSFICGFYSCVPQIKENTYLVYFCIIVALVGVM